VVTAEAPKSTSRTSGGDPQASGALAMASGSPPHLVRRDEVVAPTSTAIRVGITGSEKLTMASSTSRCSADHEAGGPWCGASRRAT
jgi:hypothetical protein